MFDGEADVATLRIKNDLHPQRCRLVHCMVQNPDARRTESFITCGLELHHWNVGGDCFDHLGTEATDGLNIGFGQIDFGADRHGQSFEHWIQTNAHWGCTSFNSLQQTISGMIVTRGLCIVHTAHDTACGG